MSAQKNPFVEGARNVILEHNLHDLQKTVELLGNQEPMLSRFNLECVANEAHRQLIAELINSDRLRDHVERAAMPTQVAEGGR